MSLVVLGGATAATQAPTFARADHPFIGNEHIAADFNGDGRPDLAGTGAQAAAIRLNNGAGAFGPQVNYPIADWAQDLAAGDFNGDGRMDLILTINTPQIGLSLLLGNGDGTFAPSRDFANTSGFDSPAVAAVDLSNDGKLDVVVAHEIACYTAPCVVTMLITVMLGNGDGTFQPAREIEVGRGMTSIAVGDFNRDGRKDLAIAGDNARVYRLHGNGDGTFTQQPTLTVINDGTPNIGVDGTDIDVADFNGDAIEDLVVAMALNGSRTVILIGIGDGTFRAPLIITEPNINIPHRQAVGDYNSDGFQDLALSLADGNTGLMEILNGNGDGTFQPRVLYLKPPNLSSIAGYEIVAANLNGDTKADLVLGISGAAPGLAVLLNTTGASPPQTPTAPTLVSPAQDATPAQPVVLDWTDVSAATSYRIQIDDSSNFSTPIVVNQTVTASQLTAPTLAVRQHWWRVRGINSAGTVGAWSSTRRFTPQAAAPAAPVLSTLVVSPSSVVGGNAVQGTATLTSAAPAGGAVVTLSSSSSAAAVPASVTVAAGATSGQFTVSTVSVSAQTPATITGVFGGVSRSATLTVTPPPPPPPPVGPASLFVSPATVEGGTSVTGTIFLTVGAPAGGLVVSLSSSNTAAATVAATMTVPGGLSSATFPVSTLVAETTRTTTITASANGVSKSATLTVNGTTPPPPAAPTPSALSLAPATVQGGSSSTGTVTLSAAAPAGGQVVQLSSSNTAAATLPASITVAAGTTSTTFNISTTVASTTRTATITASANAVSRTATLTVNGSGATGTVTISRAEYKSGQLRIEATGSPAGTLTAYVTSTNQLIGTISGGRLELNWPSNPVNVTVRSTNGGSASRAVST